MVVAGTHSGVGKTTVVCALAAALARRRLDVRTFKVGPDYLDPTFHRAVLGRDSRNLDGWMMGQDGVAASYRRGAAGGDIVLVEGMMGLFDGRDPSNLDGSAAELAMLLGAPVALVVDASAMARSAAAVVEGFANHVPELRVAGAIFNRVGGPGHVDILRRACTSVRVLGALPERKDLFLPSRHLGLISADHAEPTRGEEPRRRWRAALADWAEANVDLDALLSVAATATGPRAQPPAPVVPVARVRVGLAWDEAFHFYYPDNLELLEQAGATLVRFSPMHDRELPTVDGLYLGGGYPEEYASSLSFNESMRAAISAFNGPIYAECGGLMYLGQSLTDREGTRWPMVGRLPLRTAMQDRLRALGYREVVTTADSPIGPAGTCFRGHAFHYSRLASPPPRSVYVFSGPGAEEDGGYLVGRVLGSYVHAHWASNPEIAASFVRACALS